MKASKVFVVAAMVAASVSQANAAGIDLSLSNDTAMAKYITPLSYSGYGHTDLDFGVMYTESDDLMASAGIQMMGEAGSHAPGLTFGVGARAYAMNIDKTDDNIGSVTLGGTLWFVPQEQNRLGFVANLNFGPDVTTFGDAERFWDFSGRAEFEVLPEAAIYVGYRKVRTKLDRGYEVDLDKGWHLGLRMSF